MTNKTTVENFNNKLTEAEEYSSKNMIFVLQQEAMTVLMMETVQISFQAAVTLWSTKKMFLFCK